MKIFRLARANAKKHKLESISLFFLILLCMTVLSMAVTGINRIDALFDDAYKNVECVDGYVFAKNKNYLSEYSEYIANDARTVSSVVGSFTFSDEMLKFHGDDSEERSTYLYFITPEEHEKIEKLSLDSSMTMDMITAEEHFIILPYYAKFSLNYKEGETFTFRYHEKDYSFRIAGFYESGLNASYQALQCIVSRSDASMLSRLFGEGTFTTFNLREGESTYKFCSDFRGFVEENAVSPDYMMVFTADYETEKEISVDMALMLMDLMIAMSAVIFISVAFIIVFRIKNDIDEQLVSIGVLEALGYSSAQIALSYVLEYLISAVPAVVCGLLLNIAASPAILRLGEIMTGHRSINSGFSAEPVVYGFFILLIISLLSFLIAVRIRKIPPVAAFRKGSSDNSRRKNFLSIEKTRSNVHLRLAAKGFLANMKTNIGMGICVCISVTALMVCFVAFDFVGDGTDAILRQSGKELSDLSLQPMVETDTQELTAELLEMPEVRKASLTNDLYSGSVMLEHIQYFTANVYENFDDFENVAAAEGRMPENDNEIVIYKSGADRLGKTVGDTVTLSIGKIEADYVLCGVIDARLALMDDIYITADGFKRIKPSYRPNQIDLFLREGVDRDGFREKLFGIYGTPASDAAENDEEYGSAEERIRAEVDRKIGVLLQMYGVNHLDYTIQIGDQIISGSSSRFKLKSAESVLEEMTSTLSGYVAAISAGTGVFMVIALLIIAVIITHVVHSAVRKQRGELGVLKGLGYTSNELMLQTALRILPMLIFAVILGSVCGMMTAGYIYSKVGELPVAAAKIAVMTVGVAAFGFAAAYFSARRIKNISVYELMQE